MLQWIKTLLLKLLTCVQTQNPHKSKCIGTAYVPRAPLLGNGEKMGEAPGARQQ